MNSTYVLQSPHFISSFDQPGVSIVLEPLTDVNYSFWSKTVMMALVVKNKAGFVDGLILSPSPVDSPTLFSAWSCVNSLVMV